MKIKVIKKQSQQPQPTQQPQSQPVKRTDDEILETLSCGLKKQKVSDAELRMKWFGK